MPRAISRESFDALKNYLGVFLQQGRVILDSDWNENQDIAVSFIRRTSREALGDGSPNRGFAIDPVFPPPPQFILDTSVGQSGGGGSPGQIIGNILGAFLAELIAMIFYMIFGPIMFFLNFPGALLEDFEKIDGWSLSSPQGVIRIGKDRPYQGKGFLRLSGHPGTVEVTKTLTNIKDLSAYETATYRYRLNQLTPGPMKFFLEDNNGNRSIWDSNNHAFASELWLAGFAAPLDLSYHIVTHGLPDGIQEQDYDAPLTVYRGTAPMFWSATGPLPAGVTLSQVSPTPTAWQTNKAHVVGDMVFPKPPNDHTYKCTTAGTSGATQPVFPTTQGQTVSDNTVVWTEATPQESEGYRHARLHGKPTVSGNFPINVTVTDANNNVTSRAYTLKLKPATAWQANAHYNAGDIVFPTTPTGNVYVCTKPGTSGNVQPLFPSLGQALIVTDNTVIWKLDLSSLLALLSIFGPTEILYMISRVEIPTGTPADLTQIRKYGFVLYQDASHPLVWDLDDLRLGSTAIENQTAANNFIIRGSQFSEFLSLITLFSVLQSAFADGGGGGAGGGGGSGGGGAADPGLASFLDLINTDFQLSEPSIENAGRFYVDGYPCLQIKDILYTDQMDPNDPQMTTPPSGVTRLDTVYLDVWTEPVTYVEDPEIREIALGGSDTATRLRVRSRVRVKMGPNTWQANHAYVAGDVVFPSPANGHFYSCQQAGTTGATQPAFPTTAGATVADGTVLWIETFEPPAITHGHGVGLGTLNTEGSYTGKANRLYLIEIDKPGDINSATFRWSEDNASSIQRVIEPIPPGSTTITVEDGSAFHPGDLILIRKEFGDEQHQIASVLGNVITLATDRSTPFRQPTGQQLAALPAAAIVPNFTTFSLEDHPRIERWNAFGVPITADPNDATVSAAISLNDGVEVRFGGHSLLKGDYWNFMTRYLAGDAPSGIDPDTRIEQLSFQLARGVVHRYSPLALITRNGSDPNPDQIFNIMDRRQRIGSAAMNMGVLADMAAVTGPAPIHVGGIPLMPAATESQFLVFWSGDLYITVAPGVGAPPASGWAASTSYNFGDVVHPTPPNGHLYSCTVAGTSGLAPPSFLTDASQTVTDNTVTWQEASTLTIRASFYNDAITNPQVDANTGKIQDRTLEVSLPTKSVKTDIPLNLIFSKSDTSFPFLPITFVPTSIQLFVSLSNAYTVQLTNMKLSAIELKKSF